MRARALGLGALAEVLLAVAAMPGPAAAQASTIGEYHAVVGEFGFTLDLEQNALVPLASSATYQVVASDGTVLRSEPVTMSVRPLGAAAQAEADYTCVWSPGTSHNLQVMQPMNIELETASSYSQYIVHAYVATNARQVTGPRGTYWTRQVELCTVGGGSLRNGYHQTRNGSLVTLLDPAPRIIGSSWGTEVIDGSVSSTLGFQAGPDPFKITGSVTVQPQDQHAGNFGPVEDIDPQLPTYVVAHNHNRINSYYFAEHTWVYSGTSNFQGNTGQVLYEFPMDIQPPQWVGAVFMAAHCARPAWPWDKEPCDAPL